MSSPFRSPVSTAETVSTPFGRPSFLTFMRKDGELGWPSVPGGKLGIFLRRIGVQSPAELPGRYATIRVRRKQGTDGITREFLGFVVS